VKVLTLTQPWATLIAIGAKHIETRSWNTNYRGPLAIHAAQGIASVGAAQGLIHLCQSEPFHTALAAGGFPMVSALPRGAIVATCVLIDCVPTWPRWASVEPYFTATHGDNYWHVPPPEPERSFGDYTPGRFAWLLGNVKALPEPVPCKGHLGLWQYEGAL
jgi:activating signal cointegrator 1